MNPKSLLLVLLSISAYGQSTIETQNLIIDQTIDYINQINTISTQWTRNPKKEEYRKELGDLIKSYKPIQENITSVLIIVGTRSDEEGLQKLLNKHFKDRKRLVEELLLWKYQKKEIIGIGITLQLDSLVNQATEILANLHKDRDLEDAVTVLLSEDIADRMHPLSKDLIDRLSKLKE
jgi:hypothetical protein